VRFDIWLLDQYYHYGLAGVITTVLAVAYALTVHEYAHGRRALAAGDRTAKLSGRLSLNPIDHYDPVGSTLLLLFGFGWAKPVPVNPYNFQHPRRDGIMVAFWGPLSNFISAVFFALVFRGLALAGFMPFPLDLLLLTIIQLNVLLGVFNLIPIPPLDGSHILAGLLPYDQARRYEYAMQMWGMLLLIILIVSPVFGWILWPFMSIIMRILVGGS
jgi:Zn-dependent protease